MISKQDMRTFGEHHRVLLQTKDFICLRPHAHLSEYISNYNITFPTQDLMPVGFTEMPCGCATLTIEQNRQNLSIFLDGPTTKPYVIGSQANQLELMITIEFKPAGFYTLIGISQSELTDQTIPLDAINPAFSRQISEAMEKAVSISELAVRLDSLLLTNMRTICHPQLRFACQSILAEAGNTTVKQLSTDTHYSERQLNRIFKEHIGMSAKSFSRLVRINHTFRLLKKPNHSLTFISDVAGFHDLSHFHRDFNLVCGITPQTYRENMSDFYINPTKF